MPSRTTVISLTTWQNESARSTAVICIPTKGNYSTYLETKAARMAAQGQRDAKLAKRMQAELEWVRSSPKARQAKNKARLEELQPHGGRGCPSPKTSISPRFSIPVGPRLGAEVLNVEHLHKEFDGHVLMDRRPFLQPAP